MTSKESLKHLMEGMALSQAKAQIIMGMPSKDEMEINKLCYQQVLKDLEILEIIKNHIRYLYDENKENEYAILYLNDEILNNDIYVIKEWLDNGKD